MNFLNKLHIKRSVQNYSDENNDNIPPEIHKYFKQFEELNTTTNSIYDLGKYDVLIILKNGRNLTSWDDVEDKDDVLFVSEDLSNQTSLSYKYENLTKVKVIIAKNVSSEVKSLSCMFANCQSLECILGLESWDVSAVYSFECMFGWCKSLTDLSGMENWDVSNVCDMTEMFTVCENLTKLDGLEKWDTSSVTTTNQMFRWCNKLSDISALRNWNTNSLKIMSRMFWGCEKLEDLTGLSNWDVSNVEEMTYTFIFCKSLTNLDAISNWDVSSLVNARSMFDSCSSLENNNGLKSWKFNNIKTLERMYDDCTSLVDVSASQSWTIPDCVNTGAIFRNCPKIQSNPFDRKLHINTDGPKNVLLDKHYFMDIYGTGWCAIQLGDIYSRASYITDVPGDCLRSIIKSIKEDCDFEVDFNAEGYSFTVKADNGQCYFNFDGGEQHAFDNMNKYDLALQIYEDISNDISSWNSFYSSKNDIPELLDELKELIDKYFKK